jgi:hypothetical protein
MSDPNPPAGFDRRLTALSELVDRGGAAAAVPMAGDIRYRARRRLVRRRAVAGVFAVAVVAAGALGVRQLPTNPPTMAASPTTVASSPAAPAPTAPASGPASASPPVSSTPPSTPPSTPAEGTVPPKAGASCKKASLAVTTGAHDAATGHRSLNLVFRNIGPVTCTLKGYPGVDGLDASGQLIAHANRTPLGFMGGLAAGAAPAKQTLQPGESTTAMIEGTAGSTDGSACTGIKELLVTAPDDTDSTTLSWSSDVCGNFEVHPVGP